MMSGHTSTAGHLPAAGATKYASILPSGVSISTSFSVITSGLTGALVHAANAAKDIAPKPRRDNRPEAKPSSLSSSVRSSHIWRLSFAGHITRPMRRGYAPTADSAIRRSTAALGLRNGGHAPLSTIFTAP